MQKFDQFYLMVAKCQMMITHFLVICLLTSAAAAKPVAVKPSADEEEAVEQACSSLLEVYDEGAETEGAELHDFCNGRPVYRT